MTTRTATAVIVQATMTGQDCEERTSLYGPFLPHVGSAVDHFMTKLERELMNTGKYSLVTFKVEDVFIGDGESDCAVQVLR